MHCFWVENKTIANIFNIVSLTQKNNLKYKIFFSDKPLALYVVNSSL
jgi:hypothetical protein